jgi:serine/threonine protein kinase/Tol biopolymer transport system component
MIGKKLAHYEVVDKIGAGGMGEVYRAHDTKLGRDVALKILPDMFSRDPERLARFEREARLLAALNHTNIAGIYGLEHDGHQHFLALELVDGEDLSKRIGRGPVAVDETLQMSRQIALALETAHEQGIVHRDLKPGNIVVTPDGDVKVLDFGLAKALDTEGSGVTDLSHSPTIMTGATMQGVILGTAAYMSPEQARGKRVDKRADIWAFGCVVYELLSGKHCFNGETVSDTLASVLAREPEWENLPGDTPVFLRKLIERCLNKDPKLRLRDIGEARILIDRFMAGDIHEEFSTGESVEVSAPPRRSFLPWLVAAVFAVAAAGVFGAQLMSKPAPPPVVRAFIPPAEGSPFELNSLHPGPAAVSPDGTKIVFTARDDNGNPVLWIRHMDQTEARIIPGTEGAGYPFWSPDSRSIGFIANGKLKRVDSGGGPPLTLCDATVGKGGSWNADDVILFAPSFNGPIHRVPAAGGVSVAITEVDNEAGQNSHRFPCFLPDGLHFLYLARAAAATGNDVSGSAIFLGSLDDGSSRELFKCQSQVIFASGHLLFVRESALMARPFDIERLEFTGDAFPIVDHVNFLPAASRGIFDASQNGVLIYLAGASTPGGQIEFVDRTGATISTIGDRAIYSSPTISPDGTRIAVEVTDSRNATWDVWVFDIARGVRTRFTFGPSALNGDPVWAPDGSRLLYRSDRGVKANLYAKSFAGSATEELILDTSSPKDPTDWSRDGKYILYNEYSNSANAGIWVLPMDGDREPFEFITTDFVEIHPRFSPDGKWVAYSSDESGRYEVYIAPFPGPGRKWQISSNGGLQPRWRGDSRELFFQSPSGQVMSAELENVDGELIVGADTALFDFQNGGDYDVTDDGQKFLIIRDFDKVMTPLTLVINWNEELKDKN